MSTSKIIYSLLNPTVPAEIDALQAFLDENVEEEYRDTREINDVALNGKKMDGTPSGIPYFARVTWKGDEIVSTVMCGLVPMKKTGGRAVSITYAYTAKGQQGKGYGTNNLKAALDLAANIGRDLGEESLIALAETEEESQGWWDKQTDLRRFFYKKDGKIVQGRYEQQPLELDPDTAEPADGACAAPLHLAISFFGNPTPAEQIARLIDGADAIQTWSSAKPREYFTNGLAYSVHKDLMRQAKEKFDSQFDGVEELLLLTAEEVERLRSSGAEVVEFAEADAA